MKLRDFSYWSFWRLSRAGLSDFDVVLYQSPRPLGFYQPASKAICMSMPYVLLVDWSRVMKSFDHEIAHALTSDEKEIHGPRWEAAARANGSVYRSPEGNTNDEFRAYCKAYFSDPWRRESAEIIENAIASILFEEARARGTAAHKGILRLEFVLNQKTEENNV